jgi:hypothetical protein
MPGIDIWPGSNPKFPDLLVSGVRQNALTHDWNRVWTGNNAGSVQTAYRVGRITAPTEKDSTSINRFFFHYNPQSVQISTNADPNVRAERDMEAPKVFADITANQTMSFEFLLNRMYDVALQIGDPSAKFYGTLHDLYYLYGVINRNFKDVDGVNKDFDYPTTDVGLLQPTIITVIFGESFRFVGSITDLSTTHAKFVASPVTDQRSAPLVPVLTYCSMSLKRALIDDTPKAGADAIPPLDGGVDPQSGDNNGGHHRSPNPSRDNSAQQPRTQQHAPENQANPSSI